MAPSRALKRLAGLWTARGHQGQAAEAALQFFILVDLQYAPRKTGHFLSRNPDSDGSGRNFETTAEVCLADAIGLAFQAADDLEDATQDTRTQERGLPVSSVMTPEKGEAGQAAKRHRATRSGPIDPRICKITQK